jgi:hypothetical protein
MKPAAAATVASEPPRSSRPVQIEERVGLMGKRGTAFGAANFGCAALMIGVVALVVIMFVMNATMNH